MMTLTLDLTSKFRKEMFDHFWSNVNYNNTEFDDPPTDWVPENQELRLWNE